MKNSRTGRAAAGGTRAIRAKKTHASKARGSTSRASKASASPAKPGGGDGALLGTLHLQKWIAANRAMLKPPVGNRQLFTDSEDVIVFVSGGPNTRNDFHVNPTEELFYQIKGDIAVRVRPLDGSAPHDIVVKEGELFLLPRWVPHRPQRPAGTVGLIVEFPRPEGELDGLRWYCPACDELVNEARWQLRRIDEDLKEIMEAFWDGPEERRTCEHCGKVIERAGAIALSKGKVVKKASRHQGIKASSRKRKS